jgi:thymidylate synthase (FAD)
MKIVEQSVELIDHMGSDLSVVNAARVSFHKESDWAYDIDTDHPSLLQKDYKLIGYLARHGHWTPFGHAFLSFRIKAPIFVARQLVKHQVGLVWNEVSRRYVDDEPEFWFPKVWRKRAENVKQGSSDEGITGYNDPYDCYHAFDEIAQMAVERCFDVYEMLLEGGVAPEQARIVLPQNTMTEWIWSGSIAAFARVCKLRLDPHAQAETREIAEKIRDLVPKEFEHSWKALIE